LCGEKIDCWDLIYSPQTYVVNGTVGGQGDYRYRTAFGENVLLCEIVHEHDFFVCKMSPQTFCGGKKNLCKLLIFSQLFAKMRNVFVSTEDLRTISPRGFLAGTSAIESSPGRFSGIFVIQKRICNLGVIFK
jgi:hypothetical protein